MATELRGHRKIKNKFIWLETRIFAGIKNRVDAWMMNIQDSIRI
jgi:hypothetical protein